MRKTTTINGINFEVKKFDPYAYSCYDLFQLYARPSSTKVEIYNEWQEKLNRIYGVSGNKHQFIIYGNIKDQETGLVYDVRISQAHNYVEKN